MLQVPGFHLLSKSHAGYIYFCGFGIFVLAPGKKRLHIYWKPLSIFTFRVQLVVFFTVPVHTSGFHTSSICGITGTSVLKSAVPHITHPLLFPYLMCDRGPDQSDV